METHRPKIVVLGMMSKMPAAGVVWQNLHYLVGFERLGYEVWYVEAHARTPTTLMRDAYDDSSALASAFIERALRRVGMERQWAFHALHADGRCYGLDHHQLQQLYRDAALIVNLHGGTVPSEEHSATGRLVYLETDPVEIQIQLAVRHAETLAFLEPHVAFFTFGENYGRPGCGLPVDDRIRFRPTRQPVVLDFWDDAGPAPDGPFTTIGNWRQPWRDVVFEGERYGWTKHEEFLKVLDLPSRAPMHLELALSSYDADDAAVLSSHGWRVRPASEVSDDPDDYRRFVHQSGGEFTVAKDQNVRFRTGWFSDRSATYLAAGRPVVTQDTAFGDVLPTGEGLFAFSAVDDAAAALDRIASDPLRHQEAARAIGHDYFAAEVVLGRLLDQLGLPTARRANRGSWQLPFPRALDLEPRSRRPLELEPATEFELATASVDHHLGAAEAPEVSVVVVTFNQLSLTRLCLETLLAGWDGGGLEVIVVDNASTDATPGFLARLAERNPAVRVTLNDTNVGFVEGCNQGLAAARAPRLVILNNDTIPPPGALRRLVCHLDDPTVGLVGPITNHAPNEARVPVDYRTYGGLVAFAERQSRAGHGLFELPVATLFCAATRRDVIEGVGVLDSAFGLGLFDDDDFSLRVRRAGYRVVCAEDVFVHHVGEAAFGELVPDGRYNRLLEENRRRFEAKWGQAWEGHHRRRDEGYESLLDRVQTVLARSVPPGAEVAVISRGDDELLRIVGPRARHFPAGPCGGWAGHHPADDKAAVAELRRMAAAGATHLLIPATERWWLDHYGDLRKHLERTALPLVDEPSTCILYALDGRRT